MEEGFGLDSRQSGPASRAWRRTWDSAFLVCCRSWAQLGPADAIAVPVGMARSAAKGGGEETARKGAGYRGRGRDESGDFEIEWQREEVVSLSSWSVWVRRQLASVSARSSPGRKSSSLHQLFLDWIHSPP